MKKIFLLLVSFIMILVSCGNTTKPDVNKLQTKYAEQIQKTESKIDGLVAEDNSGRSDVMLQAFTWESKNKKWWNIIASHGEEIGEYFDYVWFPPASDSYSPDGYLPRELYKYSSAYGNEKELREAIAAIAPAKAVADVVANHRVGATSWGDFVNPTWETVKGENYKAIAFTDEGFFNDENMKKVPSSMRGARDTGDGFDGGRDLDHTNPVVQQGIIEWMENLKELGFAGWRFDYAKGFDGAYIGYYNQAVETDFAVGEYWVDNSQQLQTWINETAESLGEGYPEGKKTMAFDFRLKSILNNVFGKTKNTANKNFQLLAFNDSLMKVMPNYAVTFVDNHDTGSTQGHWSMDSADLGTAYAFILTHPGIPCVSYEHYGTETRDGKGETIVTGTKMTLHDHINYLISLRKACGITNTSEVEVEKVDPSVYKGTVHGDNGDILVVIAEDTKVVKAPKGFKAFYSGDNWIIYTTLN